MKEPNEVAYLALIDRLRLEADSELPKGRQLYLKLYDAISHGVPGRYALLPPTRLLSQSLGVGRNTVTQVYEQLASEGLVEGRGRAGTQVIYAGAVPVNTQVQAQLAPAVRELAVVNRPVPLSPGEPDATLFPQRDWARALAQSARDERDRWGYVRDAGHPALRDSITRYLAQYRGLQVQSKQVIITAGTRQSLILAAAMYGSAGDTAWVEEPGYLGAVSAWRAQGLNLQACPVDTEGLSIPSRSSPRLIYTTPCFHYPLGITLSAQRRQTLVQRAAHCGAVIFEDDYDSEFRDQVQPRPALASESTAAVLHAGTFS
ncbi:MAG: PLP-dependent aminotransferase family protein, partial [Granulosicoccaceae bacterium]